MRLAGERGRTTLDELTQQGVPFEEARMQAERAARDAVHKQTSGFPREDFGERWSWPYGLREAMKSAANIRLHGDYGVGPRELFGELGKYGSPISRNALSRPNLSVSRCSARRIKKYRTAWQLWFRNLINVQRA